MFKAQNAAASILIGVSIGTHNPGHSTGFGDDVRSKLEFPAFDRFRIAGVCSASGDEPPE
jgi:hypothetical protein